MVVPVVLPLDLGPWTVFLTFDLGLSSLDIETDEKANVKM